MLVLSSWSPIYLVWNPQPMKWSCPHSRWVFLLQLAQSRNSFKDIPKYCLLGVSRFCQAVNQTNPHGLQYSSFGFCRALKWSFHLQPQPPVQRPPCCQHTQEGHTGCVFSAESSSMPTPSVLSMPTVLRAQSWRSTYLGLQLQPSPLSPWTLAPQRPIRFIGTLHFLLPKGRFLGLCASCCSLSMTSLPLCHQANIS